MKEITEYRVLCLGLGIQSTALLFAYENDLIKPRPHAVFFADAGAEEITTYRNLELLKARIEIPIYRVRTPDLIQTALNAKLPENKPGKIFPIIPLFFRSLNNKRGLTNRSCTQQLKVRSMKKYARSLFNLPRRNGKFFRINWIIGISTDESKRVYRGKERLYFNSYPLIEDLGWSRKDCFNYLQSEGFTTAKRSSCSICAYRTDGQWADLKFHHPEDFKKAVDLEYDLRKKYEGYADVYLHRSLTPLDECVFKED